MKPSHRCWRRKCSANNTGSGTIKSDRKAALDYQTPVEFAQHSRKAAFFPQNTKPTKLNPKTAKNSHSEWIKNRGQATHGYG